MLNLIVTMAGLGSRFAKNGEKSPKPLINFMGKPFFWWATESVRSDNILSSLTFVVLQQHINDFQIDDIIRQLYPESKIVSLDRVTSGAAETAIKALLQSGMQSGPIGFLDCDHAFDIGNINNELVGLKTDAGALCYFSSDNPAFSYIVSDETNCIVGTVEKKVASNQAIAGLYLFKDAATFINAYEKYEQNCPYSELFMSGIYNELIRGGKKIISIELKKHVSFGTPEELEAAKNLDRRRLPDWYLKSKEMLE
jgi:dTDP-glucose pyrophosphorylase